MTDSTPDADGHGIELLKKGGEQFAVYVDNSGNLGTLPGGEGNVAPTGDVRFQGLTPAQMNLFRGYVDNSSPLKEGETYADRWDKLSAAQRTTFAAVTHALSNTDLGNGKTGLSQVAKVTELGEGQIGVQWVAGSEKAFRDGGFDTRRSPLGAHPDESGLSPRGGLFGMGTVTGLHVLFNKRDPSIGHVHVDYRGLGEGHNKPL